MTINITDKLQSSCVTINLKWVFILLDEYFPLSTPRAHFSTLYRCNISNGALQLVRAPRGFQGSVSWQRALRLDTWYPGNDARGAERRPRALRGAVLECVNLGSKLPTYTNPLSVSVSL